MNLFDDVIKNWESLTESFSCKSLTVNLNDSWPDTGKNNFILPCDMAYELGGSIKPLAALGGTAITSCRDFVSEDQIILIGKDIGEIKEERPYARLSICLVDEDQMGQGEELFSAIKTIDYTRYHVNPEGFMMRVSTALKRESVRISKEAVKKGLSFANAGNLMLKSYHLNPKIKAVKIIFIDELSFDYEELGKSIKTCQLITQTIDHIGKNSLMDCNSCGLQKVCNEVEGMRELHFKNSK